MPLPNGDGILLYETGAPEVLLGSQRDYSQEESNATVDTSSKTSGRQGTFLSGRYTSRMTIESIYVPADPGLVTLRAKVRDGTSMSLERFEDGASVETVTGIIERYQLQARDQEAALVNIDFLASGPWV